MYTNPYVRRVYIFKSYMWFAGTKHNNLYLNGILNVDWSVEQLRLCLRRIQIYPTLNVTQISMCHNLNVRINDKFCPSVMNITPALLYGILENFESYVFHHLQKNVIHEAANVTRKVAWNYVYIWYYVCITYPWR